MGKRCRGVLALFRWLVLGVICAGARPAASAASSEGAGFRRLAVTDPVSHKAIEALYFYPAVASDHTQTPLGPYSVSARNAADIAPGRHPLIVVSHGNAGSMLSHHDLVTALARQGNVVIVLNHPGDNYKDQSGVGATSTVYGRPLQISAAITAALNAAELAGSVDASRIAFIGFSAGGQTGLLLAGGKIDPARYVRYCKEHQADDICVNAGNITRDRPDLAPHADPRIKAWVLMAPVSAMFDPGWLKTLTAPVLIYTGDSDDALSWQQNAAALAAALPANPELKVIPHGGHYIFLAPCSSALRAAAPALCQDAPGLDRRAVHQEAVREMTRFLERVWAGKRASATH